MAKTKTKQLYCTYCGVQLKVTGREFGALYSMYTGKRPGPYIVLRCPNKDKQSWNPFRSHEHILHDEVWTTRTKSGAYQIEAI